MPGRGSITRVIGQRLSFVLRESRLHCVIRRLGVGVPYLFLDLGAECLNSLGVGFGEAADLTDLGGPVENLHHGSGKEAIFAWSKRMSMSEWIFRGNLTLRSTGLVLQCKCS